uniref:Ig-like domain-containing protein n=1 Tax=Seriola dumerili TaxID=41447 RepID=A0A3B4V7F0_SERDU
RTTACLLYLLVSSQYSTLAQKENVLQPKGDVTATEGEAVTLDCRYNSSSTTPYLYCRIKLDEGNTADDHKERFSSTLNSTVRSVPLKIQKLQVSDSAVYYCACSPQ